MSPLHESSSWPQVFGGLLVGCVIGLLVFYIYDALEPPFFTTHSPDNTYTVHLYGQGERPAFFTVEVGAVVLKNEQPFWSYQTLHTGDFMDLSFELGWPNHRWLRDNILEFYREENFSEFKLPQQLILVNKTNKVIRQLRITSDNEKFLGFDLLPGSVIRLMASPPRGDFSGASVSAKLDDGRLFEKKAGIDVGDKSHSIAYSMVITDEGIDIAMDLGDRP